MTNTTTLDRVEVKLSTKRVSRIVQHATEAWGASADEAALVRTAAANLSHNAMLAHTDGELARLLMEVVRRA